MMYQFPLVSVFNSGLVSFGEAKYHTSYVKGIGLLYSKYYKVCPSAISLLLFLSFFLFLFLLFCFCWSTLASAVLTFPPHSTSMDENECSLHPAWSSLHHVNKTTPSPGPHPQLLAGTASSGYRASLCPLPARIDCTLLLHTWEIYSSQAGD